MGGLKSLVDRLFLAKIESENIRQVVYPDANAPVAAISDGGAIAGAWSDYVQICVAGTITDPSWLLGIHLHTPVVEIFAADWAIAIGAGGAEVDIAVFPMSWMWNVAPANPELHPLGIVIPTMYPIKIMGAPRLAVRIRKNTGASAAGASLQLILGEAIGT